LVTSDRDSFALIDETTSVLRVLNGGMEGSPVLTPQKLPSVCGVMPGQYRDFAALRGDTSDNLPGARGIGSKTAAKLLSVFRSLDDAYAAFDGGRAGELDAAIGKAATARLTAPEAREFVLRNQRLMAMHDDLVLPDLAAMKIPLDAERLRATLAARGVRLGSSLWALVGEQAPPWLPAGYDRAPQYLPRVEPPQLGSPPERIDLPQPAGPFRRLVVLPRRGLKPVLPGQLTLF
jgi:5'-3' exonuclease